jgi:uncharacterized membrane protein
MTTSQTTSQRYYLGAGALTLVVLAGTLIVYPQLPAIVPMHWDAHGQVNGWGPKWWLFLTGPGSIALIVLTFSALPWLSPKKFEVDSFRATYLYIMMTLAALLAYVHLLVLSADLGVALDMTRDVVGGACLLIALMGNVLGKVRRNFFIGVRTPWTIANEQVWNATHRFAAKTFFAGGIVGLLAVLLRAPFWVPMAAVLIAALSPVIYSLVFYKKLEHEGNL